MPGVRETVVSVLLSFYPRGVVAVAAIIAMITNLDLKQPDGAKGLAEFPLTATSLWHPHIYNKAPQRLTPHSITDILSGNCAKMIRGDGGGMFGGEVDLDQPLNLSTNNNVEGKNKRKQGRPEYFGRAENLAEI